MDINRNKKKSIFTRLALASAALGTVFSASVAAALPADLTYVTVKEHLFRQFWHSRIVGTFGNHGSPVASDDGQRIILGTTTGAIVCLDQAGKKIWRKEKNKAIGSQGVITKAMVDGQNKELFIVGTMDGSVLAIDTANGDLVWSHATKGGAILAKPYVEHESNGDLSVYLTTEQGKIFKIAGQSGEKLWSYTHKAAVQEMTVRGHSPIVSQNDLNTIFFGTSDGYLISLTKTSGLLSFKTMLAQKEGKNRFTDVDAIPAFGGTREKPIIYAASYNGGLFAIDAASGNIIWNHDEYMVSGIISDGQNLFIVQPSGLINGLDSFGATKWETTFKASQTGEPLFIPDEQALVVSAAAEGVLVIDTKTGRPIQNLDIGGEFSPMLSYSDKQLYFMTNEGSLYNFSLID